LAPPRLFINTAWRCAFTRIAPPFNLTRVLKPDSSSLAFRETLNQSCETRITRQHEEAGRHAMCGAPDAPARFRRTLVAWLA